MVTEEALSEAWDEYARAHRSETIMSQTMRMSRPQVSENPAIFGIVVQNIKQKEILDASRPAIIAYLRDHLSNDTVDFSVKVNDGEAPRHTLSDYELLDDLKKESPKLRLLIDEFKLRL